MTPRHFTGIAAVIVMAGVLFATHARSDLAAATLTPTPSPTATSTPPATPPAGTLRILVFSDLNGNGLLDPGEPGLANWRILQGCGDAFQELTTDADGVATTQLTGGNCLHLNRAFGWLPTRNNVNAQVPADWNTAEPFLFGLHDYGRTVMELRGEAISGGLPMVQGEPGIEEPFRSCGHLFFESVGASGSYAVVIVEGADTRAGCPRAGDSVVPSSDGVPPTPAPAVPFAPGTTAATSWVSNGDSMRFYSFDITDAWVLDTSAGRLTQHCAEIRDITGGFNPPGFARVFVLSDRARPGCGAPGRLVRLFRNGLPLAPYIEWRAGDVSQTLPQFELAPSPDTHVTPPNTGSAGLLGADPARSPETAWPMVGLAIAVSALALWCVGTWRRN